MNKKKWLLRFGFICLLASPLALTGCGDDGDDITIVQGGGDGDSIDAQWARSGHADAESMAFNDWNAEGEVPATCSRCHSSDGFVAYAEGEPAAAVDIGQVINCTACHQSTLYDTLTGTRYSDLSETGTGPLEPVTFPSRLTATLNDPSNMCMACHQGRASKVQVDEATPNAQGTFNFINIHYYPAAATFFGTVVKGGYEYDGKTYVGQFTHVPSRDNCVECHMGANANHTFEPQPEDCARCHDEVDTAAKDDTAFRSIRRGTTTDYDGDGNTEEGLYFEINDTLAPALLAQIQQYAETTLNTGIVYNSASYPYFFVDNNRNRQVDADDTTRFTAFDKKLLQAAYNYQVVQKEPCGYIHNARYLIQLMYDSIEDLGGAAGVANFTRPTETGTQGIVAEWAASGHADVESMAFNDWNAEGSIPTTCAKCHSREGFRDFAQDGTVGAPVTFPPIPEGEQVGEERTLTCGTCHVNQGEIAATADPTTLWDARQQFTALEPVTFPSGITQTLNGPSNMCMACHQGRASKVQVDQAVAANPSATFPFINIHYYAAAASMFGTDVKGGYEYDGQTYAGQNTFPAHLQLMPTFTTCVGCHMQGEEADHRFVPQVSDCTTSGCHTAGAGAEGESEFANLSGSPSTNYDQIQTLIGELLPEITDYASTVLGRPIAYSPTLYPYFVNDLNSNGQVDAEEGTRENGYQFDAKLLKAAYNYQVAQKEPCGFIHNGTYIKQLLYDSIVDLGGTPTITPPNRGGVQPPPAGAPTANAGPDQSNIAVGTLVTLDAGGSTDPENQALTYSWQLQGPQGSTAALTGDNTVNPTFTPDMAGTYTATVTVSDGTNTATDSVTITTVGAQPPQADLVAGQGIYTAQCAGCHSLGTFDAAGFAPNLADKSAAIATRFPAGVATPHNGVTITLSATDLVNLGGFVDSQ